LAGDTTKITENKSITSFNDNYDIFVLLETWLTNRNSRCKWKIVAMKIKMKCKKKLFHQTEA